MESATEKKRGRPQSVTGILARSAYPDNEPRTAINTLYAAHTIKKLTNGDPFFVTPRGKIRRQGIAEQIGRMIETELITEDQGRDLIEQCKKDYQDGATVKEIERRLRELKKILK